MDINNVHIPVSNFELYDDSDNHFLKVRLQAIANDENLNRSEFVKDGMEECKDSFLGKPLLCAFPKNKYSKGYKIGEGHNSSDIKYDSEYDEFYKSYLDPNSERMVGYIPPNSNISIEEIDGKYWIMMDAVILRKYNYELVKDILEKKNGNSNRDNKRISVEIEVLQSHTRKHETGKYEVEVIEKFKGMGVTILFDDTQEAIVGANLKAFSESEQYNKFKSFMQYSFEKEEYIDKEEIGSGDKLTIKRDKVSDTPWGNVNKTELYKKALKASNYRQVVRFIYAKVESGWEENPSSKLKYPIAQISGNEVFYNKGGLSSALGYSKTVGDSSVTTKVERIRKKLGLDDESENSDFAIEKNKDGKEISKSKYPDILEMKKGGKISMDIYKTYGLTTSQCNEIFSSALSSYKYNDGCTKYYIFDFDEEYVYVRDWEEDKCYRIKYSLDAENKSADIYMDTKEEVIKGGYEVIGKKGEEDLEKDIKKEEMQDDAKKEEMQDDTKKEEMQDDDKKKEMQDDPKKEEMQDDDKDVNDDDKKDVEDNKKYSKETITLEQSNDDKIKERCSSMNYKYICNAGNYVLFSDSENIYASKLSDEKFEHKSEVLLNLEFMVNQINTGGVGEPEIDTVLAPVKVDLTKKFNSILSEKDKAESDLSFELDKNNGLQSKLNEYKRAELIDKFDEISFDSNLSVSEKSEWKNKINEDNFSSKEELIKEFGGYIFQKNLEEKSKSFSSEIISEKIKNKKSFENVIEEYMTK